MKNTKLFPFERNRYYYGKLLSVQDFETEQSYVNNKRRAVNRFLHGAGVAAGLSVFSDGGQKISVERGLALDESGREILVEEPVLKKLEDLEGFSDSMEGLPGYLYLCLAYQEQEIEPVYDAAGSGQERVAYNKVREGYRLFLTGEEPEGDFLGLRDWYQIRTKIYQAHGIRIFQTLPRWVEPGGEIMLEIEIEDMGRQSPLAFSYEICMEGLRYQEQEYLTVNFQEEFQEKSCRYRLSYPLQALNLKEARAVLRPVESSFRMREGEKVYREELEFEQAAIVTDRDKREALAGYFLHQNMEQSMKSQYRQDIYLAKIFVDGSPESYKIREVEALPFQQRVISAPLEGCLLLMDHSGERSEKGWGSGSVRETDRKRPLKWMAASGTEELVLPERAAKGKKVFSKDIPHGLGPGSVRIQLGLLQPDGRAVYGAPGIFPCGEAELAASVDEERGTFSIGARLLRPPERLTLSVIWTAFRKAEKKEERTAKLLIHPNSLCLETGQSHELQAVCRNRKDQSVIWSTSPHGGSIDENGRYTAPQDPGVYEIFAQSKAYEELRASVFAVVKEPDT